MKFQSSSSTLATLLLSFLGTACHSPNFSGFTAQSTALGTKAASAGSLSSGSVLALGQGPSVRLTASGIGCDDGLCVWFTGTGFDSSIEVTIRDSGWRPLNTYHSDSLSMSLDGSPQSASLRLATAAEQQFARSTGLVVTVASRQNQSYDSLVVTLPSIDADVRNGLVGDAGGSVYSFFDLGRYATDPTDANWSADVKSVIGHYNEDPARVRNQLRRMRDAGQKRIGFVIWFIGGSNSIGGTNFIHTIVPFPDGRLGAQHQANLGNFLKDIDDAGFTEVQIRFGFQGNATYADYNDSSCVGDDLTHPCIGDAASFDWAVAKGVINQVESMGLNVNRLYDVAPELPGHPYMATDAAWYGFTRDIWTLAHAYMAEKGFRATMSFNGADPAGTEVSLQLFDQIGYPSTFSIDAYKDVYTNLVNLEAGLARHGHAGTPVFIQETFFDDVQSMNEARRAIIDSHINLQYIMQWPVSRPVDGSTQANITEISAYDEFLRFSLHSSFFYPAITSAGLGCDSRQCIWLQGSFDTRSCVVELFAGDWRNGGTPEIIIQPGQYGLSCSSTGATFQIPPQLLAAFDSLNVLVADAANPLRSTWSQPIGVRIH